MPKKQKWPEEEEEEPTPLLDLAAARLVKIAWYGLVLFKILLDTENKLSIAYLSVRY